MVNVTHLHKTILVRIGFFMARHPELSTRKSQTLDVYRAHSCTRAILDQWHEVFLESHNILDCISAIDNCDEMCFPP